MSTQIAKSNLQELTTSEQQIISGGYGHCSPCSPCCPPPRRCYSNFYDNSMPYGNVGYGNVGYPSRY